MKIRSAILLILAFALVVCSFTGCSNNVVEEGTTEDDGIYASAIKDIIKEEDSTTAADAETTKAPEATTVKEAETKETTTKAPETTTKAPETTTKKQLDVRKIASSIAGQTSLFEEPLFASSTSIGLDIFGIPSSLVEDAAYYVASAAVAEEVIVVKAVDASAVTTIQNCIEARRSMQIDDYTDYVPKEVPKLQTSIVYIKDNCVVFCVSNNNSVMRSYITNLF